MFLAFSYQHEVSKKTTGFLLQLLLPKRSITRLTPLERPDLSDPRPERPRTPLSTEWAICDLSFIAYAMIRVFPSSIGLLPCGLGILISVPVCSRLLYTYRFNSSPIITTVRRGTAPVHPTTTRSKIFASFRRTLDEEVGSTSARQRPADSCS